MWSKHAVITLWLINNWVVVTVKYIICCCSCCCCCCCCHRRRHRHHCHHCQCWQQLLPLEGWLVWELLCLAQISGGTMTNLTKIVCGCSQRTEDIFCWDLELGYDFFLPHTFQFIVLHSAWILYTLNYWHHHYMGCKWKIKSATHLSVLGSWRWK